MTPKRALLKFREMITELEAICNEDWYGDVFEGQPLEIAASSLANAAESIEDILTDMEDEDYLASQKVSLAVNRRKNVQNKS